MGRFTHEPLWRAPVRGVEGGLAGSMDGLGLSEVDLVGRHQPDTSVMVVLVVPSEEPTTECEGVIDGFELLGEFRLVKRPGFSGGSYL